MASTRPPEGCHSIISQPIAAPIATTTPLASAESHIKIRKQKIIAQSVDFGDNDTNNTVVTHVTPRNDMKTTTNHTREGIPTNANNKSKDNTIITLPDIKQTYFLEYFIAFSTASPPFSSECRVFWVWE
jgi:hypothetical protein